MGPWKSLRYSNTRRRVVSGRSSVTLKKNRSAVTVAFRPGAATPLAAIGLHQRRGMVGRAAHPVIKNGSPRARQATIMATPSVPWQTWEIVQVLVPLTTS